MADSRILVWGAGAIGGIIGAYLARAGHEVTFVDIERDHVAAIRGPGLHIHGPVEDFTIQAPAFLPDAQQPESPESDQRQHCAYLQKIQDRQCIFAAVRVVVKTKQQDRIAQCAGLFFLRLCQRQSKILRGVVDPEKVAGYFAGRS